MEIEERVELSFHGATRVEDHDVLIDRVVKDYCVQRSAACELTPWPPGDTTSGQYLLALDCPRGRAVEGTYIFSSHDQVVQRPQIDTTTEDKAFAICAQFKSDPGRAIKLEIKSEENNIATTPATVADQSGQGQNYFVMYDFKHYKVFPVNDNTVWTDGIAMRENPRLVQQFSVCDKGKG